MKILKIIFILGLVCSFSCKKCDKEGGAVETWMVQNNTEYLVEIRKYYNEKEIEYYKVEPNSKTLINHGSADRNWRKTLHLRGGLKVVTFDGVNSDSMGYSHNSTIGMADNYVPTDCCDEKHERKCFRTYHIDD